MKHRRRQRKFAQSHGYFWLPCPLCGQMFGGHEWQDQGDLSSTVWTGGRGVGICPVCTSMGLGNRPASLLEREHAD